MPIKLAIKKLNLNIDIQTARYTIKKFLETGKIPESRDGQDYHEERMEIIKYLK